MLSLQNSDTAPSITVDSRSADFDVLLSRQWLLTNRLGSYAASSILGCNTSSYHGLLVGSLAPPTNRIVALSNCLESLITDDRKIDLSTFEFDGAIAPRGYTHLRQFRRDIGAHFEYGLGSVSLTKSLFLACHEDTLIIEYDIKGTPAQQAQFQLRPLIALRDFHALLGTTDHFHVRPVDEGLLVWKNEAETGELHLTCTSARFEQEPQWWYNFWYRDSQERGQDAQEALWMPGAFVCQIDIPAKIVFRAQFQRRCEPDAVQYPDGDTIKAELIQQQTELGALNQASDATYRRLSLAADQFVVTRPCHGQQALTLLAGYPWFADWGRDTFIALPGLLLCTGRHDQARSVLTTFARAVDQGMIPNRFDDRSDMTHFNSVDASLWFINAAFQYLDASHDSDTFVLTLLPVIHTIVDAYYHGTRFGIHADHDGLITAGNRETQLTWMDAKCDGVAFTPRHGKAVEVNALWHHAIACLGHYYLEHNPQQAQAYQTQAAQISHSFQSVFWNNARGYLNDAVYPDGSVDASLRPNQIYAVALARGPVLSQAQQISVVRAVESRLLTPFGLRTLDPDHPDFKGAYTGPPWERDSAYHQGTVWPYLLGGFADAYLKIHAHNPLSRRRISQLIEPLIKHFTLDACLGSVSEIFDGNPPHRPKGCFAQAWSVAELLRIYRRLHGPTNK